MLEVFVTVEYSEALIVDHNAAQESENGEHEPPAANLEQAYQNFAAFCRMNLPRYASQRSDLPLVENSLWRLLVTYHDPVLATHLDTQVQRRSN